MKNYLLTDFNTERWSGIDIENVEEKIGEIVSKNLLGEIGNPDILDISLNRASHTIKNITLDEGKVYGDVEFLNNENGKKAKEYIDSGDYMFGIRSTGINDSIGRIILQKIYTWDIIIKN